MSENLLKDKHPIDFTFLYSTSKDIISDTDIALQKPRKNPEFTYRIQCTCRCLMEQSCDFIVWAIYEDGKSGKQIKGEEYHLVKTAILDEYKRKNAMRKTVMKAVIDEMALRGN